MPRASRGGAPSGRAATRHESQPEIQDDEEWTSGDVCLISADNIRFRVAGLTLAWASPVFSDMISLPESAEVLRLFLNVVSVNYQKLGIFHDFQTRWRQALVNLVRFLDKYQSERGLKMLRSFGAESFALGRFKNIGDFVFASSLNDAALCYQIVKAKAHRQSVSSFGALGSRKGGSAMSLADMSYASACAIPFHYHWALMRAATNDGTKKTAGDVAHKFVELILEIRRESSKTQYQPVGMAPFPAIVEEPNLEGYKKPDPPPEPSTTQNPSATNP